MVSSEWRWTVLRRAGQQNDQQSSKSQRAYGDRCPSGPIETDESAFLGDAGAQTSIEMRGRFAGNERFNAAIDEHCHFARVVVGVAASVAFGGVGEKFRLVAWGKAACRGVCDPIGIFFAAVHCHLRLQSLLLIPGAKESVSRLECRD